MGLLIMLVTLDSVTFGYADNLIFTDVGFSVYEGEHIGLIGANGEGKTTLIKLILGELEADGGLVTKKNGIRIGYLEQNGGYESGNTVYSEMLALFCDELAAVEKLSSLSAELSATPFDSREYGVLSAKIESLNKYISAHDCFNVEVKIRTVLNGMGFKEMYERVIDTLSGGEKTRLKLARLLLENPDLLILDEPTNHLDISTLFWLEEYLQTFKGSILTVSHDRYFLDRTISRILEIDNRCVLSFNGNYTKYKVLKAERNARLLKEYEAQQEERAKLQDYVDRNQVRASTAKSAQSRIKQLEKMQLIEKPLPERQPPSFKFGFDVQSYEQVLDIDSLNLERGGKRLITDGKLSVKRGEKWALIGENGVGKSSLLKEIISSNSSVKRGRFVKIAYYDQEAANLDGENTVLSELWGRHTGYTQTEARGALARCGLFADDMQKKVCNLSGGERAKLALCILECERGNVLLLDEPTNHLDLPAREGLEKALKEYGGTLVFVSHDRYFISVLADNIAEIEDGKLKIFRGGYADYKAEKDKADIIARTPPVQKTAYYRSGKERAEAEKKKLKLKKLEEDIANFEREEDLINAMLADPSVTADYVRVNELVKKLEEIKTDLEKCYNEYGEML